MLYTKHYTYEIKKNEKRKTIQTIQNTVDI